MRNRQKYLLASLLLLTIINAAIYLYRDNFIYHKKGTNASLYSSDILEWKQFVYDYPSGQLKKAKQLLDDSIKIHGKTTVNRILEIGRMLFNRFSKQAGRPSDTLLSSTPFEQYQMLCSSDKQEIWCGVYAGMFAFFCWSEGIPCRVIEIMNAGDHHVLNECYLSETNQWAMVDLTFNRLLIWNQVKNRYINFFDILNRTKDSLVSMQTAKGYIIAAEFKPSSYDYYLNSNPPVYYYYRINNFEVYKTVEKAKRYLFPVVWYEEVNTTYHNFLYYVKELFLLLWLIFLVVWLAHSFRQV